MDTWNETADWARPREDWLRIFLELPGGIPSHDTINRVFRMIEPDKFHEAFFRRTGAVAEKTGVSLPLMEKPSDAAGTGQKENSRFMW